MFGGWGTRGDLLAGADFDRKAREWGVPMGGNLRAAGRNGASPGFVFQAAKDPLSGNLDRIQVIKLWRDARGSHERIFDVAWSAGRTRDPRTGRLQPVGNTVDVATAKYTNTIGAAELTGTWIDPDFDATAQAIYYARVLEIPTPRWDTYLAVRSGVTQPADAKLWLQERAWTSPIYYTP
jgi:ribosomal protein L25 (general stress protein Ctc)